MKPIKPVFSDDKLTLFRGDALRILPQLTFDHCICDPPYEATMHKAKAQQNVRRLRNDGGPGPRAAKFKSIDGLREPFLPLLKVSCAGWLLAFCTPEGIAAWRDSIEDAKLRYKRACFWIKPDAMPQLNGQGPAFAVEPFVTAWCGRGYSRWNAGGRKNWWESRTHNPDREGSHPTEKPVRLMSDLIEAFTKPGDLICDPFMGSGTTIIAALATGRRVIGIEKDAASFKLARGRIESAFTMGPEEARRHITRTTGRLNKIADGPLFTGEMESGV